VITSGITLNLHLWRQQQAGDFLTPELVTLLQQIAFAAKLLSREIGRAALVGQLGVAGTENATGDTQKKLDILSNQIFIEAFYHTGLVAAVVSEELEEAQYIACGNGAAYVLCVDPLDGSSNIDNNGCLGTIFGIYRRISKGGCGTSEDLLRQGTEMVAAGYILYSASTTLVYTCGSGVDGFTLDQNSGEFLLSHPNLRCPEQGVFYSANLGYFPDWQPQVQEFAKTLNTLSVDGQQAYSLRYAGALVADVHRSLVDGGLYFYPPTRKHPEGKLRLLYECAPLAFVVEQAGGKATTGTHKILALQATSIHQRSPLVIGSCADVDRYETFVSNSLLSSR
jgi:fructose-1,6-bisphosphatase I